MNLYTLKRYKYALLLIGLMLAFCDVRGQTEQETTLKLTDYRGSIQWEQSFDKTNWVPIAGGNVSELKLAVAKTSFFQAKVTEDNCAPIYSKRKAIFVDNSFRIAATSINGKVILPPNTNLNWNSYNVISVIDSTKVLEGGLFNIYATDSTQEDMLMLLDRTKNSVFMLGYFIGVQDSYTISSETTALALLMMNPYTEVVSDVDKHKLMESYKRSDEFKTLLTEVEKIIQAKKSLFDPMNVGLHEAIGRFGGKDFIEVIEGRIAIVGPIATENKNSQAWFRNTSAVSYSGKVVKKGQVEPVKKFLLAGSLLIGSDYLNLRNTFGSSLMDVKREIDYDFFTETAGEYEIIFSNGLNFNQGNDDDEALRENAGLLVYTLIDKLLPVSEILKLKLIGASECFSAFIALAETEIKIYAMKNGGTLKENWYIDVLTNLSKGVIDILDKKGSCQLNENTRIFFRAAFELFSVYHKYKELNEGVATLAVFSIDYALYPSTVKLCKYIDPSDNKVYNCFSLRKISQGDNQNGYVCDTLASLAVELVENKAYYPDQQPVEGFTIAWQTQDRIASSVTNPAGYAELKNVILLDKPGEQIIKAGIYRTGPGSGVVQEVEFRATATRPVPQIKSFNEIQSGEVGQKLARPISLMVYDGSPLNLLNAMKLSRFEIRPEVKGGGTIEPVPNQPPFSRAWSWTLGPQEGDQFVTFTIVNKTCSPWQIQGNPVTFKATAEVKDTRAIFVDPRDGQEYPTVQIGTQTWMAKNLNYVAGGSWCYDNNAGNCDIYGRLYNWETAVNGCPTGWRLPSYEDLQTFQFLLNNSAPQILDTLYWDIILPTPGRNSTGFSMRGGGYRAEGVYYDGTPFTQFLNIGGEAQLWSSTLSNPPSNNAAWIIDFDPSWSSRIEITYAGWIKRRSFSVRCLKN